MTADDLNQRAKSTVADLPDKTCALCGRVGKLSYRQATADSFYVSHTRARPPIAVNSWICRNGHQCGLRRATRVKRGLSLPAIPEHEEAVDGSTTEAGCQTTGDLNIRVQARLAEVSRSLSTSEDQDAFDRFVVNTMMPSWRERWERHQPEMEWRDGDKRLNCPTCGLGEYQADWPCEEARSVLKEIGVEP